jgi:GDSL-like Lipase/Acylhydrolase family
VHKYTHRLSRMALLLMLLLGLGNVASAQTVTPCCGSEIKAFETQDASFPQPQGAVEVVGSSTIRLWGSVRNDLAPLEVIPRGFGGSSADDLDYYLDRIVLKYAPRAVAIYEGDTDTGNGKSAEYVAGKLQQIVARIRTQLPATRVYIISVKPSPKRWAYWPVVQQLNLAMQEYCTSTLECTFIDVATALLDASGKLVPGYYDADQVHLSPAGYGVWTGVVGPALMAGEAASIVLPQLQNADAGFAPTRGSLSATDGFIDVTGSGVGTQGLLLDGFRYGYRQLTGNGQVTVRLTNQLETGTNPLAGVMIRERLTPESRYAMVFSTPGTDAGFMYRGAVSAMPVVSALPQATAGTPRWLRLVRKSNVVTGYLSADGKTWQQCGTYTFSSLTWKVFIGVAVTSSADGALAAATFDNAWIYGTTALPAAPAVDIYPPYKPKTLVATALATDQISLSWVSGGDKGGSGTGGYRVYRDGILVGVTRSVSFIDTGLAASTTYSYTVSAYDKASPTNAGLPTAPIIATTLDPPPL